MAATLALAVGVHAAILSLLGGGWGDLVLYGGLGLLLLVLVRPRLEEYRRFVRHRR